MTRISERNRYEQTNLRLNKVRQIGDDAEETSISGRKLRKVSDDPVASVRVFRNRTKLENLGQFRKTLDFARGFLAKSEDAILSINESLIRAKELSVQQSNGTWDASNRASVAEEVKQLAEHVAGLGNSTYGDRFVFGGFQTSQPPIGADGTYSGDDGVIFVQVDEDSYRPLNVSGREIFEVGVENEGKDKPLVKILRDLYANLQTNDLDGVRESMTHLDKASQKVVAATATLGARRTGIEDIGNRLDLSEAQLYADNNSLEGADVVKASLDLKRAETALQTTLTASGKMLTPSLMNFLQ